MKILWMSDSPTAPSGFGNVTRFVCAGLAERGHQVSILGWQAKGQPEAWGRCTVYPVRHSSFGEDVLLSYLQRVRPDVLVTLADVWWLTFVAHPMIAAFMRTAGVPWALYYPIAGDLGGGRLPPSWVQILQTVDLPIAMSGYGREVTLANGVTPAYIPHGVDTEIFRPPADKAAAKARLGYAGRFVVLCDARNQPRKLIPRLLDIFRRFATGKDDVLLHLHCDPEDPAARSAEYCYNVRADVALLGLTRQVRFTDGMAIDVGVPIDRLAAIYQAADVHLLASWGEGFGLPTLQAAAAGVVPMASDYTASRELVLGHGEAIRVRAFVPDGFGLRRAVIDVDDAVGKLEQLYRDRARLTAKAAAARRFAEPYDWARVVPQWHDLLTREVPRVRELIRSGAAAAPVTIRPRGPEGRPDLARVVRGAFSSLPDGVDVTVRVVERRAGQLMANVLRDAADSAETLTIPITRPPADGALARARVTGCVFVGSATDRSAFRKLIRVFPGLRVWSSAPLDFGPSPLTGQPIVPKVVPPNTETFRRHLAASTLALDLGGGVLDLPAQAAELGVPCLGLAGHPDQAALWPELALPDPDPVTAAELGRDTLTDFLEASRVCTRARERLASLPTHAAGGESR